MSPGPKWLEWMQRLISQNVEEQCNFIYSVEVVEKFIYSLHRLSNSISTKAQMNGLEMFSS